ncbi:hypothetical protein OG253_42255 (plasmid) [Streptomyces virginiae]|nr:hypothetical protein OG253_42255 [Streptomyces virginiae]
MATGIVSIGLHLVGQEALSLILFVLAALVWLALAVDFARRLSAGASLVLDAVDKLHPGVQDLSEALERHFRTDVQANLYASWHPTEAFGIHWDDHDTVIFQLEGAKRWNLYGATRTDPLRLDVEAPEKPEGPPLAEVVLQAGDMLYVPRGLVARGGRHPGPVPAPDVRADPGDRTPPSGVAGRTAPPLPHPARERAHGGRPGRAHRVRRAVAQGGVRGAPPPHRLGARRLPGRPRLRPPGPPPSRTSAMSPPTPAWSWPSPPPGPRWREPTRPSCCGPPGTNGSSTRSCAPCWRPWSPAPA